MTELVGPTPRGPRGFPGLYPAPAWAAGTWPKDTALSHLNCIWRANKTTAQEPAFAGDGSVASADWDLWVDGRGIEEAGGYVDAAVSARDAANLAKIDAQAARDAALASERRIRSQDLGDFADDAAAIAWAAAQTPAVSIFIGSSYWNTTTSIKRICSSVVMLMGSPVYTWVDEDADAATQRANAQAAAVAAQNAQALAEAARDTVAADATAAHNDRLAADADAIATAADRTAVHADRLLADSSASAAAGHDAAAANSNSAVQAALLQTIGYAALAQAGAASVSVQTGLSILAAAKRATELMSDGAQCFIWAPGREVDANGVSWVDKCAAQLWMKEALNTATRGATDKMPKLVLVQARNSASGSPHVVLYDLTDQTVPMWMVFNGSTSAATSWFYPGAIYNVTSLFAMQGRLYVSHAGAGGLYIIDFIADNAEFWGAASYHSVINGSIADRNSAWTSTVISGGVGATVNSIAATVAPNTPKNPARCDLPNPTVAVGTNGGVSVIRWDGVVSNSTASTATMVAFDDRGNLWSDNNQSYIGVASPASYMVSGWSYAAMTSFTAAQLGSGTALLRKIAAIGNGMVAIAHTTGLTRIKLDPTNPAQSLINIKTATYDTGWMVLGKTVLAMAESNADLSAFSAAEKYTGNSATPDAADGAGWASSGPGAGGSISGGLVTVNAGGFAATLAFPTTVGKAYKIKFTGVAGTGSPWWAVGIAPYAQTYPAGTGAGAQIVKFIAITATSYLTLGTSVNSAGLNWTISNLSIKEAAADRSGSGNHADPVGAPTRAVVAAGADTAGVGFGGVVGNNLQSGNVLNGATDAAIIGWWSPNTTAQAMAEWNDPARTGDGFLVELVGGSLQAYAKRGGLGWGNALTTYVGTGAYIFVAAVIRGTKLELYLNSTKVASATISATAFANASAITMIGAAADGTYASVGNIALPRFLTYAPTPDQIAFMYADEKARFAANAQSLLTGANVQGVAFDPDTGNVGAANSTGGLDVFNGSVRVANDNSATGSTNKAISLANWKVGDAFMAPINGVTSVVAGAGYLNGSRYVDVLFSGTCTGATSNSIWLNTFQSLAAVAGDTWSAGLGVQLVGGALTNISGITLNLEGWTSANGLVEGTTPSATPTGTMTRVTATRTMAGGTVAKVNFRYYMVFAAGAINATIRFYQPNLQSGASEAFAEALSLSANSKSVAMGAGIRAQITAAGLDVNMPATDGLRATSLGIGSAKRAVYDPDKGVYSGVTTDATPTVFASIPIPEGKALRFFARVASVQYGGTATEKAVYEISGLVTRDLGGNVTVVSTTTTLSEVTASMDCIAQANTTAQTLEVKGTGKAATRMAWVAKIETTDVGLMAAA